MLASRVIAAFLMLAVAPLSILAGGTQLTSSPAAASVDVRQLDEIWLVSTRRLGSPGCCGDAQNLQVMRLDGRCWRPASLADFLAGQDPQKPTLIYVHGNRIEPSEAFQKGWAAYRAIANANEPREPMRLVIWSWPSSQVFGPLRDVRLKAQRALVDAHYLGEFLAHLDPGARVTLLDFSYGAKVILGALHLRGGGSLQGRRLATSPQPRTAVRVVLMAGAADADSLLPGRRYGLAMSQIERLLVFFNTCDPALRWYHLTAAGRRPQAIGYRGVAGISQLGAAAGRVQQFDVRGIVGCEHDESLYFGSEYIMSWMRAYAFWRPL